MKLAYYFTHFSCLWLAWDPTETAYRDHGWKFIELSDLLLANLNQTDPNPQLLLDGRLVLKVRPKKQRRCIQDISSWLETFTTYMLVSVSILSVASK